ncbi:class I SAM-dependent methyltransferase [Stappia indica]|uniref:Methyltransferase domain-containing protein n=1 Tax=Stappia indica TaxID=538381 RepID=A0A857C4C2_9HYPH|nr:class I SAM-dependent methyltransferase [Stappia indica]QGZ33711.1 methyltransferase domain-containing protein [Stappia indica]
MQWNLDAFCLDEARSNRQISANDLIERSRLPKDKQFKNPVSRRRHDYFAYCSVPFICRGANKNKFKNVLEVGCGQGAKIYGLSRLSENYTGIDIDKKSLDEANSLVQDLGLKNVRLIQTNGDDLEKIWDSHGPFDLVIFYAVLEHMTFAERMSALNSAKSFLERGAAVYIGEGPNRLNPIDLHTSEIPHFDALPDDIAAAYATAFPSRQSFKDLVLKTEGFDLMRTRAGRGFSYHEFNLIFEATRLQNAVKRDGWAIEKLNQYPLFAFEGYNLESFPLVRNWSGASSPPVHPAFARSWIDLILVEGQQQPEASQSVVFSSHAGAQAIDYFGNKTLDLDGKQNNAEYVTDSKTTKFILNVKRSAGSMIIQSGSVERTIDFSELPQWSPLPHAYRCFEISGIGKTVRFTPIGDDSRVSLGPIIKAY